MYGTFNRVYRVRVKIIELKSPTFVPLLKINYSFLKDQWIGDAVNYLNLMNEKVIIFKHTNATLLSSLSPQ